MYDIILKQFDKHKEDPIDVITVGLGFMGFGFISSVKKTPGLRVPLVITRRVDESLKYLLNNGFQARHENNPSRIKDFARLGYICVSDDLSLIKSFDNKVVVEMTGTVPYATEVALATLDAGKHLVTTNPELQVTTGHKLRAIAEKRNLIITDAIGDQPGSLARLIGQAKLMGFNVLIAGNMKRYLNRHATLEEMTPWAQDKGLSPNMTVSFTDGTKQSIEMNLVANYFNMNILEFGMKGPIVEEVHDALKIFDYRKISENGIVDYVIGKKLFPGVFIVAEHRDSYQKKYLRYLGLGEGPRYVMFEPYHLIHLEVAGTIAKVVFFNQESINNKTLNTRTIAVAKRNLKKGEIIDGIGRDMVYGNIDRDRQSEEFLPIGLAEGAKILNDLHQDGPIKLTDVVLPDNCATRLLGYVKKDESLAYPFRFTHLL